MKFANLNDFGQVAAAAVSLNYNLEEARDYIGISQIGYCSRKLYHQHTSKDKVFLSDRTISNFFRGHALHDHLPSVLWKMRGEIPGYKYLKSEKEIEIQIDKWILKGHVDHIAELDGKQYVIDWKFVEYIDKLDAPSPHYVDQMTMYGYGLGIQDLQLVYFDSSNPFAPNNQKTFTFKVDHERVGFLKHKFYSLMLDIENGNEPEKPFDSPEQSVWECYRCPYSKDCWGEINKITPTAETVAIPEKLEQDYIQANEEFLGAEHLLDTIKDDIKALCNGASKGLGKQLTASLIVPKPPKDEIDVQKLEEICRLNPKVAELVKGCWKKGKEKSPYYRMSIKPGEADE